MHRFDTSSKSLHYEHFIGCPRRYDFTILGGVGVIAISVRCPNKVREMAPWDLKRRVACLLHTAFEAPNKTIAGKLWFVCRLNSSGCSVIWQGRDETRTASMIVIYVV
ncbi:hypothetical protein PISMIDRAFT_375148 [Pisolithus microcarpus 441]|uniref:Uncharacterized protein n=1 Tax=Pisolithus microcarpus 441 TaxID=765257 RepID=A0A0C9YI94_9AGAM|nr:hypothetical protein PISMIDRAFT_375148 [Pisolithus microcarpus 441]